MAVSHLWQRAVAVGLWLAVCSCGEGLERVTRVEAVCTAEARLAIRVHVFDPDGLMVDSVTALHATEEPCFLERFAHASAADAGEPDAALYACFEQGEGDYLVRVTSGENTWTQSVLVPGDDCHVTEHQDLTFELR